MNFPDATKTRERNVSDACCRLLVFFLLLAMGCGDLCGYPGRPCPSTKDAAPDDLADVPAVLDIPGGEEVAVAEGHYPPGATPQQILALSEVNRFRRMVGVDIVDEDEALNQAAQAHAMFIVKHCQDYATSGLSAHAENPAWEGFTGVNPWDRTAAFGFSGSGIGEVIAFNNSPVAAVAGWMETLYHRLPLIDPAVQIIGYGNAALGAGLCSQPMYKKADVMDLAFGTTSADAIVLYPPDKATGISTSFDGYETPQPPPPPAGYPSGTIITVQFGKKLGFKIVSHRLLEAGTVEVPHFCLAPYADAEHGVKKDPNASSGDSYLAMYAHAPLKPKTAYTVVLDLVRGGKDLHLEWTFTTGKF